MCTWRSEFNFREPVLYCHHMGFRIEFEQDCLPKVSDSFSYITLNTLLRRFTYGYFSQNKQEVLTNSILREIPPISCSSENAGKVH